MKNLLHAALLVLALAAPLRATVWDTSTPLNTDPISQGDDRIREMKSAIQDALRGGATEGDEAIFPGGSPLTAPIFRYRGLKGSTSARPAAQYGGLYYNTTTKTLQRSDGTNWDDVYPSAETMAIHYATRTAITSASGIVTLSEAGNSFDVSGTEAVTSIAGWSKGRVIIKWVSARILTYNSSTLILKQGLSRNVVAGDISVFEFTASNTVREIGFYGASAGLETGQVISFAGTSCPSGTLETNGSSQLRTDYPGLFAVIGTAHGTADGTHFNLPDLRGRFIRGYDHGAGNDPDAASRTASNTGGATGDNVGSLQADELKAHTHNYNQVNLNFTKSDGGSAVAGTSSSVATSSTGGNETRPKNISLLYCIKY
jgi:microcystin-dependent protein